MFEKMADDRLEVVLGQRDHTISFTKTHRQDLLAVIEAMNEEQPESRVLAVPRPRNNLPFDFATVCVLPLCFQRKAR